MSSVLAEKTCTPCRGGVPPLTVEEAEAYRVQAPEWALRDEAARIERTYRFRNFGDAFAFVCGAGELAEAEFHHPDIRACCGLVLPRRRWDVRGYASVPQQPMSVGSRRQAP